MVMKHNQYNCEIGPSRIRYTRLDGRIVIEFKINRLEVSLMINKIKGYRVMCRMNQEDMSIAIGMPKRTYCDKENGISKFSVEELIKIRDVIISKGIEITLDELAE